MDLSWPHPIDRIGNLFEHLILQLILSSAKAHDENIRLSTYRTEAGVEVDFILEKDNELFAIEVKATKNIGAHDLRGLKSFSEFYGKKLISMVVYLGEQELLIDRVQVLPVISALKRLGY